MKNLGFSDFKSITLYFHLKDFTQEPTLVTRATAPTTMGDKSTNFDETIIRDPLLEQATLIPAEYSFFLQHQS